MLFYIKNFYWHVRGAIEAVIGLIIFALQIVVCWVVGVYIGIKTFMHYKDNEYILWLTQYDRDEYWRRFKETSNKYWNEIEDRHKRLKAFLEYC